MLKELESNSLVCCSFAASAVAAHHCKCKTDFRRFKQNTICMKKMGDNFDTLEEDYKEICDLMRRKIDGRLASAHGGLYQNPRVKGGFDFSYFSV